MTTHINGRLNLIIIIELFFIEFFFSTQKLAMGLICTVILEWNTLIIFHLLTKNDIH